jgi:hypothetical protein
MEECDQWWRILDLAGGSLDFIFFSIRERKLQSD